MRDQGEKKKPRLSQAVVRPRNVYELMGNHFIGERMSVNMSPLLLVHQHHF